VPVPETTFVVRLVRPSTRAWIERADAEQERRHHLRAAAGTMGRMNGLVPAGYFEGDVEDSDVG
jgi:hypothetical protein